MKIGRNGASNRSRPPHLSPLSPHAKTGLHPHVQGGSNPNFGSRVDFSPLRGELHNAAFICTTKSRVRGETCRRRVVGLAASLSCLV